MGDVSDASSAPPPKRSRWWAKKRVLLPVTALLALFIGSALGGASLPDVEDERDTALARADQAESAADDARQAAEDAEARANDAEAQADEAEVAAREEADRRIAVVEDEAARAVRKMERTAIRTIEDARAGLEERERDVIEREQAVQEQEEVIARSTFGNGVYIVGEDVEAGQYRGEGGPGCYWERSSLDGDDIIDNHFSGDSGPVVATLVTGELFETDDCGTWTR